MKVPFLDLSWQHSHVEKEIIEGLNDLFQKTSFILGPQVKSFEESFAAYIGAHHCVGVSGGTAALELALEALQLEKGSEVLLTPTTFFATASAVVHAGLTPRFVDIDPSTGNMSLSLLEKSLTSKTKAIIPVHLYGRPVDMDTLMRFAETHKLFVIEDAAQAHGAKFKDKKVGTFGHAACFSFYPGKNLGAYGDAGCVVTNDPALDERIRRLRNHGCLQKYDHELVGYNAKLDSIQAIVLSAKLKHLDDWNAWRRKVASKYDAAFTGKDGLVLVSPEDAITESVRHLYLVRILNTPRQAFIDSLTAQGVATNIHYPTPLHLVPAFKYLGYSEGDIPHAERFAQEIVSLPIFPGMSDEQIEHVITSVSAAL